MAEKVGELLAASQWIHAQDNGGIIRENVRQCVNAARCTLKLLHQITQVHVRTLLSSSGTLRIDTLLKLCGLWRISPLRFLTEPIPPDDQVWRRHIVEDHASAEAFNASTAILARTGHSTHVHRTVVLRSLEDALAKDSCILLQEVAASLGLRSIRRFYREKRSSELAHAIAAKNAKLKKQSHNVENQGSAEPLKTPPASSCSNVTHFAGVPRAVVRKGLEDALAKDSYTRLKAVAASVGLNDTKRFYMEKPLSELAHAIAAKNAELKRRGKTVEDPALTEALNRAMASSRAKIKRPCVPRAVVQRALEDALTNDTCISLRAVAASLGLRSVARFYRDKCLSDLVHAVAAKNAELCGVPRAVVRRALEDALARDAYTTVASVAASLGLRSTRRLYGEKSLSDLAHAISAKNAELKKRYYERIDPSLKPGQPEHPVRTIRDVARRLGDRVRLITKRFSIAEPVPPSEPLDFRRARRQAYRLNEVHRELEAALLEDPAPAFFTVLERLRIGPDTIRQTFPRLCRCIRERYRQQKTDARAQELKAFTSDVREALALLQHADLQPTFRRVVESIRSPRFRGRKMVCRAINAACQELSWPEQSDRCDGGVP